ncbi:UDP-N-acetylglucosamine 4,6-dehydratase (inverting) [Roseibium sp. Sym1]|uniref:UDP-N-acetylglucosamine 4,6-dehydratase (inverting) n=1 Tax=Roseibium sp. Sym1 TaxID=3016006 RepID=UPI0022B44C17|nr:UDP-N-acetylglucosamine 4,6-dehydratase (inverting) [Roseibium sp. Sym1]
MYRIFDAEHSAKFDDATILVTGGTGSFGKQFVKTVLRHHSPHKIIVFSRDELKQFDFNQELQALFPPEKLRAVRFFIGDVRDQARLQFAMREVDYVVHAAALKQVPAAEYNPQECVRTNIQGAENVVSAALANRVKHVVALSTDKAANPINLYGATKLASDKIFVAANNFSGNIGTRFAVVRYGNVVGSRGSVVPFFRGLLERGVTELPITDERMTRFWITLEQGVAFVISSFAMMRGGEIFIPKIPSMKITDLAEVLAPGLPHKVVGIRPGEKLHEIMISEDDSYVTVEFPDRYAIEPAFNEFNRESYLDLAHVKRVTDRFSYTSDNNSEWLDASGLEDLLSKSSL